jgi:hypothetical protein
MRKSQKQKPSACEIAGAIAEARLNGISTDLSDALAESTGVELPYSMDDLIAARMREGGYQEKDREAAESDCQFLLGVEVGRRLGGVQ